MSAGIIFKKMLTFVTVVIIYYISTGILYLDTQIDNLHLFFFIGSRLHFNFLLSF